MRAAAAAKHAAMLSQNAAEDTVEDALEARGALQRRHKQQAANRATKARVEARAAAAAALATAEGVGGAMDGSQCAAGMYEDTSGNCGVCPGGQWSAGSAAASTWEFDGVAWEEAGTELPNDSGSNVYPHRNAVLCTMPTRRLLNRCCFLD